MRLTWPFRSFFVKVSSRASAALVKTAVSNFMKSHEMPLPVDEEQCACGTPFDHIVFLAVPIMAVLKMFSPTGGHGAAFVHQTAPSVQTQFSDDSNASRPVSIVDGDNRTGHVEGDQDSDSDVKIAVLTAVAALASLTSRRHIGILLTSGTETTISHLLPQVKELLQKKHFDFEYHLCHLSSEHMRELSSSMHAHSAYLSTHLPAVRKRAAHKQQSPTDNSFFDYINFCLLRSFSGSASPEVVIFIMDQCLILGFTVMLPLISTALLLGSSGELLALENCDNAVECFDNYCRVMTVGKLRR